MPGCAAEDLRRAAHGLPRVRPECLSKQVTAAGFQLKGSGWYVTDFRGNGSGGASTSARPSAAPAAAPAARGAGGPATRRHRVRGFLEPRDANARHQEVLHHRPADLGSLVITVWVLGLLVATLEGFVPGFLSSESLFGVDIPGFRFVLVVAVVLLTGIFAANLIGRTMVDQWEALLGRIPLVRSIYNSVKQVSDTVLAPNGQAFRRAVLVQYPRAGAWTIAFVTGTPGGEVAEQLPGEHISVYVPTTPNPTSGFFLMVPRTGRSTCR